MSKRYGFLMPRKISRAPQRVRFLKMIRSVTARLIRSKPPFDQYPAALIDLAQGQIPHFV
jgi:hypothetical protein